MENNFPKRKNIRLKNFDYNETFAVFLTICTKDRRCVLSRVVGTGVPDGPLSENTENFSVELTEYGKIADRYLRQLDHFYDHISVDDFVIMPNHIHLLISFHQKDSSYGQNGPSGTLQNGPSGRPVPTRQNSEVAKFVSTWKRFCNKEYGLNIWQARSFDHVIRDSEDLLNHKKYIRENPAHWMEDDLFTKE